MNKNAIWLVISVLLLGSGIVGSCVTIPGTHWVRETTPVYEKTTIFDVDGNEVGYTMTPVREKIDGHWIPSLRHVYLCIMMVLLAVIGGIWSAINIARLCGWEPNDC
jgi:hypothetical protein